MTPKHLDRITKTVCGLTTTEAITGRILLEAKRLLSHQEMNLNEIAFTPGFGNMRISPAYSGSTRVLRQAIPGGKYR